MFPGFDCVTNPGSPLLLLGIYINEISYLSNVVNFM